ncbi:MAG: serine hydrolase domain-containing protein [Umezawaea sp.]
MRRTAKRIGVLGAVVGLTALAVGGTATADTDTAERIDRGVVQRAIDKVAQNGAAGVQVRVTDGRRGFTARSGIAEWGGDRPVPPDGRFRIGSIKKVFVSTVVLQLVGEGKVDLDAPVARYLLGLLPDGDRITVRMLLQHTSGLYNYTNGLPLDPASFETIRYKHWEPEELVALATAKPLDFPPGTKWSYSNTNYIVAGMLVEKITGKPYAQAVERRVLQPLRLRDTSVPGDRVAVPGPHAHGYYKVGDQVVDITRLNPSGSRPRSPRRPTTAPVRVSRTCWPRCSAPDPPFTTRGPLVGGPLMALRGLIRRMAGNGPWSPAVRLGRSGRLRGVATTRSGMIKYSKRRSVGERHPTDQSCWALG